MATCFSARVTRFRLPHLEDGASTGTLTLTVGGAASSTPGARKARPTWSLDELPANLQPLVAVGLRGQHLCQVALGGPGRWSARREQRRGRKLRRRADTRRARWLRLHGVTADQPRLPVDASAYAFRHDLSPVDARIVATKAAFIIFRMAATFPHESSFSSATDPQRGIPLCSSSLCR